MGGVHFLCGVLASLAVAASLQGCALPAAAPTADVLERPDRARTRASSVEYILVHTNAEILPLVGKTRYMSWPADFSSLKYTPSIALRPGDVVSVSVYETGGASLFSTPSNDPTRANGGTQNTIPPQVIEPNGRIMIPFVGPVSVAGLSPQTAGNRIADRLRSEAIRPQVVVTLVSNVSNTASISGEVNKAGLVPLTLRGERVLDAIASAGGSRFPTSEVDVRLIRGGQQGTMPLTHILAASEQNVVIRPNDNIVLTRNPRTFSVMGASQKVAQYTFDTAAVSLAEGLARAGGLIDTVGNPSGVYVLRTEPEALACEIVRASGASAFNPERGGPVDPAQIRGPTRFLYRVDLSVADGYFKAQRFMLQDKDIVLVSNAEGTQLLKLLAIARGISGIGFDLAR